MPGGTPRIIHFPISAIRWTYMCRSLAPDTITAFITWQKHPSSGVAPRAMEKRLSLLVFSVLAVWLATLTVNVLL